MKKSFLLNALIFCLAFTLISGCAKTPHQQVMIFTVYPYYNTVEEAKESADIIIEGRIISANVTSLDITETLTEEKKRTPNYIRELNQTALVYRIQFMRSRFEKLIRERFWRETQLNLDGLAGLSETSIISKRMP